MKELIFDRTSKIAQHFIGTAIPKNVNPSLEEIKEISKVEYFGLKLLEATFPEFKEAKDGFGPVMIAQRGGAFSGCYGPVVRQLDGKLVLCAGLINAPLDIKAEGKTFVVNGKEVDILTVEVNGYENPCVSLTWEIEGSEDITIYFPLGMKALENNEKPPTAKALKSLLKAPGKLAELLLDPPKPQVEMVPLKYLVEGKYKVIGVEHYISKNGDPVGKLIIEGAKDENDLPLQVYRVPTKDQEKDLLAANVEQAPLEILGVYAHRNDLDTISRLPDVSPEKPATLLINSVSKAKNGGYSVSHGLILHPEAKFAATEDQGEDDFDLSLLDSLI